MKYFCSVHTLRCMTSTLFDVLATCCMDHKNGVWMANPFGDIGEKLGCSLVLLGKSLTCEWCYQRPRAELQNLGHFWERCCNLRWVSGTLTAFSVLFPCYCLERLFSEVTYDVSTGMLNPTHSLTHGLVWHLRGQEISDGSWHSAVGIIFVIWHYCIVQYCEAVLIWLPCFSLSLLLEYCRSFLLSIILPFVSRLSVCLPCFFLWYFCCLCINVIYAAKTRVALWYGWLRIFWLITWHIDLLAYKTVVLLFISGCLTEFDTLV